MTQAHDADVSVCGLGPMGMPIARRLCTAKVNLTVWNRSPGRSAELGTSGASVAASPALAARRVVLTVLPDLPQVEEILRGEQGLLAGWHENRVSNPVLVIHGTTSPIDTAAFAERMRSEHEVIVVDAPLSGGTVGAAAGTLSIMVGGDAENVSALLPIFSLYGQTVRYFGPVGSGSLAKACNQIVVATTVAAIAESLSLAARAGLDRATVLEILDGGLASSEILRQKKDKWLHEDYSEGGSARNQLKDLRFVHDAAHALGLELPVAESVLHLFAEMDARGDGDLDHTGVIRAINGSSSRSASEGLMAQDGH